MYAFLVTARERVLVRFEQQGDRGATAAEYGIMAACVAAVIVTAVLAFGTQTLALLNLMPDALVAHGVVAAP